MSKTSKATSKITDEVIKKGKYRVFNGSDYETVHLQTIADQVIQTTEKQFVSSSEKNTWNEKADANHNHDSRYYQKTETYSKTEIDGALNNKANASHTHQVTDIVTDNNKMFVSKTEKDRWNDTNTKGEIDSLIANVNETISNNLTTVTESITKVEREYKATDSKLQENITAVQSNLDAAVEELTGLVNSESSANAELTQKVNTIDSTTIPSVKNTISELDTKLTEQIESLEKTKANKEDVTSEIESAKSELQAKISLKADVSYVNTQLKNKADKIHTHEVSQIIGLGTAATRNTGTASGEIPVLDANGKLSETLIPKIAINETFIADSIDDALLLEVQVGDIVILNSASSFFKKALVAKTSTIANLNEEFSTYVSSGKFTYLCVDSSASLFEEKFRPLQAYGDTITSGEVNAALNLKLDKSEFDSFKSNNTNILNLKANAEDVYTKAQVDSSLNNKVDKVSGKGLSTNDFTAAYKSKLDGIAANANNYVHPTGDGNLHVPATSTTNNRKFLMAGATAGALSWTAITASHITQDSNNRFITDAERTLWNDKINQSTADSRYRQKTDLVFTDTISILTPAT